MTLAGPDRLSMAVIDLIRHVMRCRRSQTINTLLSRAWLPMRHRSLESIFIQILWVLFALLAAGVVAAGPATTAGPYHVRITHTTGQPLEGARVRILAQMNGMPMGEREETALPLPGEPGRYTAPAQFAMEGAYTVTVKIAGPHGGAAASLPLRTGQNTAAPKGGGFAVASLLPWLVGLIALGFVAHRIRKTGQRPNWRVVLNRQVLGGLLLLVGMLGISLYVVRNYRRPGAMTPLEAQGMEMSTPAPPGAAPVTLARVERGTVESTVRYTGQAVAFVEQDVYPRVTGWITWMPFYVGDRVQHGQLLARLDTSQAAPQVAERRASQTMAEQGVAVARAEYQQAEAEIEQAHAEFGQRKGALVDARASVTAAEADRANADATLVAAQTQVPDAAAQLEGAEADQEFWRAQIQRDAALLKEGAVSGEEFQREKAQAQNAEAKVRQAQARINQVQAQVRAAQAAIGKADAMVRSAQAKVRQTESELEAHYAHVRSAHAGVDAARQRLAQAQAGVAQARAAVASATTTRGYSEIRALVGGIVTQRLISPGVLVNPGQAILKVAQLQPIRLQANVAEADLGRVRVGARVSARGQNEGGSSVVARVTSVTPAVDPVARTGVVEAVVPNHGQRFLPGEYVTLEISTGRRSAAVRVPSAAIRWRTPASGDVLSTRSIPYVWLAEPAGGENEYRVRPVNVTVGLSDGTTTEILSGLEVGQRVVTAGHQYLKSGDAVTPGGEKSIQPGNTSEESAGPHAGHAEMEGHRHD
jgi:RND family efflux transporter MFP subunit